MGIPHHAVNCKLIIFSLAILLSAISLARPAFAYDTLFTVEDVTVDVTADNAVVAQEKAFDEAQLKAFRILSDRMVAEADAKSLPTPDSLTISTMVKDYEVTNEQISNVRYVGTYTFRFREEAVSKFFSVTGVSFTETSSNPLLVLPVFQRNGKNSIWSEDNLWMMAWARTKLPHGIVPIEVPIGDLADITDIDDSNALTYERHKLERMLARYGASDAAIMIAVPDMTLGDLTQDSEHAIGRLRLSVYRTDRVQAEHVQDIHIEADGQETVGQLYDRAVMVGYKALQKDWKNKTVANAAQEQRYYVRIPISSPRQWVSAQSTLRAAPGVNDIAVMSMRKKEVQLSFIYRGEESRLRDVLARQGMHLGAVQPYGDKYIYDLIYDGKRNTNSFYTPPESNDQSDSDTHTF